MSKTLELLAKRRSQYALGRNVSLSNDEIEALIKEAIRLSPSSFNSQSARAVILFGERSEKAWALIADVLRACLPAEQFAGTEAKLKSFAAGVGTVLFYEDQDTIKGLQENYPLYAEAFPGFSLHSAGMAQIAVWTALAEEGIGGSLQHYSPIADEPFAKEFNIPASWKLQAQLPFGSNEAGFQEKSFIADEGRFVTLGK
ncbi:nitroreductase family protein [Pseudogemmobacter hezensis]|uniref:nitroreductase family protein n=1 Tax=Pseudogemmobacter hezensis TaxID=2737662 RepID=UPI001C12E591|nr:nitroreductase family protein [Pseudogemmobacter hezensis]